MQFSRLGWGSTSEVNTRTTIFISIDEAMTFRVIRLAKHIAHLLS